jgi:rSAM/selenodomain-associated transferase 1
VPSRRLLIFGRLPEPGVTKTRLAPALGPHGAARLYQAFLDDTMEAAATVSSADVELWVPDRPGARDVLAARYADVRIRLQRGADLGERLATAFEVAFGEGVDYALVAGSDHPTLPPEQLARGLDCLIAAHLVLGPTADGGYYAIGLRRYAWPAARPLFRDMPWSTPRVLEVTRHRAAELNLCHVELQSWYDVDEPSQLARLRAEAHPDSHTARALRELIAQTAPP